MATVHFEKESHCFTAISLSLVFSAHRACYTTVHFVAEFADWIVSVSAIYRRCQLLTVFSVGDRVISEYGAKVEWYRQETTEVLGEKLCPLVTLPAKNFACIILGVKPFLRSEQAMSSAWTVAQRPLWSRVRISHSSGEFTRWREYTGLFISPSEISELDCATTKTDTTERSISIGRESLKVFLY